MWIIFSILIIGAVLGFWFRRRAFVPLLQFNERLLVPSVCVLLVCMGFWVGSQQALLHQLPEIGLSALVLAMGAILGSLIFAPIAQKLAFRHPSVAEAQQANEANDSSSSGISVNRMSLFLFASFVAGLIVTAVDLIPMSAALAEKLAVQSLHLVLFLVGVSIGGDSQTWKMLRRTRPVLFLFPLLVAVGTLIGTALVAQVLGSVSTLEAMAIGAGFGYYSLSGVIISKLATPGLGVIALLTNLIREILTLLGGRLMARFFGPVAPIVSGAGTSMDTTLPVIMLVSGKAYVLIAVLSGIVLTLLVPILIPIILSFSS